jgi:nucleotide-binding universal stress UspA family protein
MRLLVAIDGSEHSTRALEHALDLAAAAGASVTAVTAVDPNVYTDNEGTPLRDASTTGRERVLESIEDAEDRAMEVLEAAERLATDMSVPFETQALYGEPAEVVTDFAREEGFDGIVVGHRGLPGEYERILGSVAKSVIERADVPVTVVQ